MVEKCSTEIIKDLGNGGNNVNNNDPIYNSSGYESNRCL